MFDKLEDMLVRYEEIMNELNEPDVTNNQARFRKLMKDQSDLTPLVEAYTEEYVINLSNDTFNYGTSFYVLIKNFFL